MDAEGFVVASSLQALLAQRLIRRLCTDYRVPHELNEQDKILANKILGKTPLTETFYQQSGCSQCNDTGYKGRIGVYELLVMTPILLSLLQKMTIKVLPNILKTRPGLNP